MNAIIKEIKIPFCELDVVYSKCRHLVWLRTSLLPLCAENSRYNDCPYLKERTFKEMEECG